MKKQRVVRPGILHQPVHRPQDIGPGGETQGVLLVVRQDHHVAASIPKRAMQEGRHVGHVVNAASQLVWLAEIVDPDQQSPTTAGTRRVAKLVVWRGSLAKGLSSGGGRGREIWCFLG